LDFNNKVNKLLPSSPTSDPVEEYINFPAPPQESQPSEIESGTFYITDNLNAALLRLRDPKEDVYLWIDSLCVDQENPEERAAIVLHMQEVHAQAERVYIWLGESNLAAPETFQFLTEMLDLEKFDDLLSSPIVAAKKWTLVMDFMRNRWFSQRWSIQAVVFSRAVSVLWGNEVQSWSKIQDALSFFMMHYQEITRTSLDPMGYHSIIDGRSLSANTIISASMNIFRIPPDYSRKVELRLPLETLVTSSLLTFETAEPRDAIFACLPLARENNKTGENHEYDYLEHDFRIIPDYRKTLLDVYADFIDYCIETSQSLNVICRYWAPLPRPLSRNEGLKQSQQLISSLELQTKMPSWIPFKPYSYVGGGVLGDSLVGVGNFDQAGQQPYDACGGVRAWYSFGMDEHDKSGSFGVAQAFVNTQGLPSKKPQATKRSGKLKGNDPVGDEPSMSQGQASSPVVADGTRSKHDGCLFVRGFILDDIEDVSTRCTATGVIPVEALELGGWNSSLLDPEDREVPEQLWRTLVADRGLNGSGTSAPEWYNRACLKALAHTDPQGDLDVESLKKKTQPKKTPSTVIEFLERVQQVVCGRRFFKTSGKERRSKVAAPYFGLGSPDIKSGDKLCILLGCSVPVVLRRKVLNEELQFEFFGECYVHDIMYGEALPGKKIKHPYYGKGIMTFKLV
jgi:hypothetical protein